MAPWKKAILNKYQNSQKKKLFKAKNRARNSILKNCKVVVNQIRFESPTEIQKYIKKNLNFVSNAQTEMDYELDDSMDGQNLIIDEDRESFSTNVTKVQKNFEHDDSIFEESNLIIDEDHNSTCENSSETFVTNVTNNLERKQTLIISEDHNSIVKGSNSIKNSNELQSKSESLVTHITNNKTVSYAVEESKFNCKVKQDIIYDPKLLEYHINQTYENFTPVQEREVNEDIHETVFAMEKDFSFWMNQIRKKPLSNSEKRDCPWKNWKRRDFEQWYMAALYHNAKSSKPRLTPAFIKNLKNTTNKTFMFGQLEHSQTRKRCWKSLEF